jgi:hypothetical protein
MNVIEAAKRLNSLVTKVRTEGVSIDLEQDNQVVARLTPAEPRSNLSVGQLSAFLRGLPSLGEDADRFAQDIRALRAELPPEANPWD